MDHEYPPFDSYEKRAARRMGIILSAVLGTLFVLILWYILSQRKRERSRIAPPTSGNTEPSSACMVTRASAHVRSTRRTADPATEDTSVDTPSRYEAPPAYKSKDSQSVV